MRNLVVLLFTCLSVAGVSLPAHAATDSNQNTALDRILVVVNDDIVTENEFRTQLNTIKRQLRLARRPIPPEETLRKQLLERMILDHIQLQYAERTGLKVSEAQVDKALEQIAQRNKLNLAQLRQALQRDGIDYDSFRRQIKTQVTLAQLVDRDINSRISVSDSEVDNLLRSMDPKERLGVEYNLSHIQVSIPQNAPDDVIQAARDRVNELHRNLQKGMNFEQAALQYSQGREALDGGSMGWKRLAELPSVFGVEIKKLAPGQMSGVFRDESGFHILRLNDRRGGAQSVTQTHARHILLATNELLSPADATVKADQLRERILNGEDFAQLARSHSNDTGSGLKGGDLGWVNPGEMVPEFEKAMNELEINQVSKPVKSRYGVHLIQVLGRREQDVSNERERGEARKQIHQRKARERYEQWIRQLRDEAYVEYKIAE